MIKPDIILCDIIATDMVLDPARVVVYNQNWKSPKDDEIFIVVSEESTRIIGNTSRFDHKNGQEVKCVSSSTTYDIEITSRNTDAKYRKAEILAAINSDYSEQKQELNQIRIFRTNKIFDLSFIDGRSALHRYKIPVIINSVQIYRKSIIPFDKFQVPEIQFGPAYQKAAFLLNQNGAILLNSRGEGLVGITSTNNIFESQTEA